MIGEKKKSRIISVSTGNMFKEGSTINDRLSRLKEGNFDVSGLEVCFATVEEFREFLAEEKKHIDFIRSFQHIGVHAPVDLRKYDANKQKRIIDDVYKFYKRVGAKYVVFHPYMDFDISLIKGRDWKVLIENLLPIKNVTLDVIRSILKENPEFGIMFDTCHALSHSADYFKEFLSEFKDRISAVHLSTHEGEEGHAPLCMSKGKTLELLEKLKNHDSIWVIETWGTKYSDDLGKEVHFVKSFSRSI